MKKNSNIDILKILLMFLIIGHHYIYNSSNLFELNNINEYFSHFLYIGGKFGTVIFILITGYFMSDKKIKLSKLINTFLRVVIYSYLCLIIFNIILGFPIDTNNLIKCLLPVISNRYWFISCYILLYILIPYLNTLIKNLTKQQLQQLIIILTITVIILPTIGFNVFLSNIGIFILLYIIGAYIKEYDIKLFNKNNTNLIFSITTYFIIYISVIIIKLLQNKIPFLIGKEYRFASLNSILVIISAILLFVYFKRLKVKYNHKLHILSNSTLGVYLLHDNYFIKKYIFPKIWAFCYQSNIYILLSILLIPIVYILCFIIDKGISKIIEPLERMCINLLNKIFKTNINSNT